MSAPRKPAAPGARKAAPRPVAARARKPVAKPAPEAPVDDFFGDDELVNEAPARKAAADAGERLQKLLAQSGLGGRREMEEWIAAGRVQVNGQPATLGQRVLPGDRVKVNGRLVNLHGAMRAPQVLLYHKPEGEIVSRSDPAGRPNVFSQSATGTRRQVDSGRTSGLQHQWPVAIHDLGCAGQCADASAPRNDS